VVFILEARHGVVRLLLERCTGHATGPHGLEKRQPAAMQQIVYQGRDEDRLAGTRQTCDAEPDRGIDQMGGAVRKIVQSDRGFIGQAGEGRGQRAFLSGLMRERSHQARMGRISGPI
jgi:hypothetical protein